MDENDIVLEPMDAFFEKRLQGYDEHMLNDVPGCANAYKTLAGLLGEGISSLLDLGCGTGLELTPVFERFPNISVTGIDMTRAMLDALQKKFPDKALTLICASYLGYDFGENAFDAAISFQTMHHMDRTDKLRVYSAIYRALKPGGAYTECDYMVETQAEEDEWFAESARIRREQGVRDGEWYHFDTPLSIKNQLGVLREAGFCDVEAMFREENTTIIRAIKRD